MYPITNAVKALFDAEQRQVLRITGTDRNGNAIYLTEANVMEGGFNIDRYSCNGSKLEIGTAIAAEMTLKLDNRQGQFDNVIFEGVELFVEVGIADWSQANPTVTYIPCGYFTPDEQPRRLSTISLNALDRMTRFDDVQPSMLPWTDNLGNRITDNRNNVIYFAAVLDFPATIESLVEQLCDICAVPLATDLTSMPNYDYIITGLPDVQGNITARNMIQWCAGIMASNAWIDWDGKLRFSWYNNETGYTSTTANRYDSDLYENDIVVTGVQWVDTNDNNTVYLSGTGEYVLDMSDNALIDSSMANDVLNDVYNVIHSFAYRPFKATVVPAPYLWPMDRMTFTDKNGGGHVSLLTNVNFTINGTTVIAANGETAQTSGMAMPSGFTSEQLQILRKIRRTNAADLNTAIDNATKLITGADGGYVRFIYDENDVLTEIVILDTNDLTTATKVWRFNSGGLGYSSNGYAGPYKLAMTQDGAIVADFITTGIMSANVVRAGLLTDATGKNLWDLDRGIFRLAGNSELDGRPLTQLLSDIDATITSVDVEFAQNQSQTVAPTDGWSTDAPSWAANYYIWQRTKTVTPSGVNYSEPVCISGRDGSQSTPGLNQATIYLYQRSETTPAKPNVRTLYTFVNGTLSPIPSGWSRSIQTGSAPCWVTTAMAISTDTDDYIEPVDWAEPAIFAENGGDGSSIDNIVNYYAVSDTTNPPADSEFWTPGVPALWTDNYGNVITAGASGNIEFMPPAVPLPTQTDRYVWQYQLTTYTDGTSTKSNKYISSILGDAGVGISQIVEEYYLSASNTEQVFGEWSTEQPEWVSGYYIWTRTVITWTDNKVTTTDPVLAQAINLANENADSAVNLANKAIDNTNNLDASLNQAGVFNRLTNNGAVRGIFLENNQMYVNADYIKGGTIDAALIAAGSIIISQLSKSAQSALLIGATVKTQYYLSTSSTKTEGGSWSDSVPAWSANKYVWTKNVTTKIYADNTTASTDSSAVYDRNLTTALSTATSASSKATAAETAAGNAQSTANAKITTFYQADAPTAQTKGDLWIETDAGNKLWRWNGSAWIDVQDDAIQTALTNAGNAQSTADKKIVTFSQTSQPAATDVGDLWIDTAHGNKLSRWNGTTWEDVQDTAIAAAASLAGQAQTAANSAIVSTVSVYYRSTTNTAPTIDGTTSIRTAANTSDVWTYVMPRPKNGCYFFTCERYQFVDNSVAFSTVRSLANATYTSVWCSANNASYIDGAHIYAGSVTATQIAAGTLTVAKLDEDAQKTLMSSAKSWTEYYLSTSPTQATDGTWSNEVPKTWTSGKYVWTRVATQLTKADGIADTNIIYSTAVYDWNVTEALSTASSASSTANTAQTTANSAIYREQIIYKSGTEATSLDVNTTWVTDVTGDQNAWTTTRPVYDSSYPVLFVAVQRQTMAQWNNGQGTACSCTAPVVDQTTTVIDGGHIITGSIDAGKINAQNLKVSAANVTGTLTIGQLPSDVAVESDIPGKVSELTNDSGYQTASQVTTIVDGKISAISISADQIGAGTINGNLVNAKLLNIVDANGNVLASFENIITIGKSTDVHIEFDYNSMELFDKNGNMALSIGDMRNSTGKANVTEIFIADGINTNFYVTGTVNSVISVIVDGTETTAYTRNGKEFSFATAPFAGQEVVINYKTTDPIYHFNYGTQMSGTNPGAWSFSVGTEVDASGYSSHAEGNSTSAKGEYSHAEGWYTVSKGRCSHAEGFQTNARGFYSHAEGYNTVADKYSHAEGYNTYAHGDSSHAEGVSTYALGDGSLACGYNSTASGDYSHAEGNDTSAGGDYSHAEGYDTVADGDYSHAEGDSAQAYGRGAHAEGYQTDANGDYSHTEGYKTSTGQSNSYSHAEGYKTTANGGHAEGVETISSTPYQHVFGQYNVANSTDIEIVGGGSNSTSRSNIRTLDINGNEWIAGSLTQASDARLKTETGEVPDVSDIPARCFKWSDLKGRHDDKLHLGYFAQDVEKVAPYLVDKDAMGYKSLDYIGFLVAKIASLEKRVAELEARE